MGSKLGHEVSEETRKKINIRLSGKNNPNYGKLCEKCHKKLPRKHN